MAAAIDGHEVTAAQVNSLLDNPVRALIVGLVVAGLALTVWLVTGPVDPRPLISVLLRFVLVISAMTWIGFVFPGGGRGLQQRYLEVDCPACRGWLSLRVTPNRALRRLATRFDRLFTRRMGFLIPSLLGTPAQLHARGRCARRASDVDVRKSCDLAKPQGRSWADGRRRGRTGSSATDRKALRAAQSRSGAASDIRDGGGSAPILNP
jgi:hypothetical protein